MTNKKFFLPLGVLTICLLAMFILPAMKEKGTTDVSVPEQNTQTIIKLNDITDMSSDGLKTNMLKKAGTEYCVFKISSIWFIEGGPLPERYKVGNTICLPCPPEKRCKLILQADMYINNVYRCRLNGVTTDEDTRTCQTCPAGSIIAVYRN
ncbi:MAG: hypothetical protein JNM68_11700 [Dinghuibacter sp.]|nr:hypothetical protein [Dinghuibacter sp.]